MEVEIEGGTEVENDFCGEINFGGIHMRVQKAILSGGTEQIRGKDMSGVGYISPTSIRTWKAGDSQAAWKVHIPEASERDLSICYSCDSLSAGQYYTVEIQGGTSIKAKTLAGPKGFDEYYTRHLGKLNFPQAGIYTIIVRPEGKPVKELFGLDWLFLE